MMAELSQVLKVPLLQDPGQEQRQRFIRAQRRTETWPGPDPTVSLRCHWMIWIIHPGTEDIFF